LNPQIFAISFPFESGHGQFTGCTLLSVTAPAIPTTPTLG